MLPASAFIVAVAGLTVAAVMPAAPVSDRVLLKARPFPLQRPEGSTPAPSTYVSQEISVKSALLLWRRLKGHGQHRFGTP